MTTVNRVFCYSKEEAKKNKNNTSIGKMILQIILIIFFIVIINSILVKIHIEFIEEYGIILVIATFLVATIYCSIKFGIEYETQLMGFAIDSNNNVYYVNKLNNGEMFAVGGTIAKESINRALNKNDSFAGDVAEGIGVAATLYFLNKSAKLMQNPEVIAKAVENAETATGVMITQILKVYDYTQDLHKVKIKCDYKILKVNKVKYNRTIIIYKSFNRFDELMNAILNVKGD